MIKERLSHLPEPVKDKLRRWHAIFSQGLRLLWTIAHRLGLTRVYLCHNVKKTHRLLEIGPGSKRLPSFETLNAVGGPHIDYVADAAHRLPFATDTFELIYGSHVLEHIPWYRTVEVLKEWIRILKPGGHLEIWVPNGLAICQAFVAAENTGARDFEQDGWYRFNPDRDPCTWASGRIFSYGDGTGRKDDFNWHFALFSPRFLRAAMEEAGLVDIEALPREAVRGYDHGWINMGFRGTKE